MRLVVAGIVLVSVASSLAAPPEIEYSRDIKPLLADYCLACHGLDAESREADLRLDTAEGAHDWAIVPGVPDESEVVARIDSDDPDLVMPPPSTGKSLSEEEKELLTQWIAGGAEYEEHWSFVRPQKPTLPPVRDERWVKNEIDRFVLARLESAGLEPAEEADPHTICRRVTLDITGLPPTVEQTLAFTKDYGRRGDEALSDLIDGLLGSPAWGEHRARYWLDAARYGDTHGLHFDNYREMWPYRDWVIRAFNRNQPYDEFTIEQLAGDLLPDPTDDQLIATGLQRCNVTTNEGGTIAEENLGVYAADRVQTFGWVYLGLTTNCAQCHDHKFDPISIKDYYSLAAFFRNNTAPSHDMNVKGGAGPVLVVPAESDRRRWKALPGEIQAAAAKREARREDAGGDFTAWVEGADAEEISALTPTDGLAFHALLSGGEGPTASALVGGGDTVESEPLPDGVDWTDSGERGQAPLLGDDATLRFDGVGGFELDQAFSCGLWVRPHDEGQNGQLLGRMADGDLRIGWNVVAEGRRYMVHFLDDRSGSGMKVVTKGFPVSAGTWQHVFVTYDGSRKHEGVRVFVDGKPQDTAVWWNGLKRKASIQNDGLFQVGGPTKPEPSTATAVQDARLYDRELGESEVSDLYESDVVARLLRTDRPSWSDRERRTIYDHYLRRVDERHRAFEAEHLSLTQEQIEIRERSPLTHVLKERDTPAMASVLMRGAYDSPGEEVPAAPPAMLHAMPEGAPPNRLGLAQWVVDPANPLTARVTVNRFWQEVFGSGIVGTPEDFGIVGAQPTHPGLLDWLATDFREGGWDVKRLFKQFLMSSTYRQAAVITPEKLERDRDNTLLSRGPRFRMDAEMIRDAALATSGLLSQKMHGPGVKPYQPGGIWNIVGMPGGDTRNYKQGRGEDLYRRSVYTFWKRMAPPPNLRVFNAPTREVCTVRRERTNTPLQALTILNDPQFVEAARRLAERLLSVAEEDEPTAIDRLGLTVLSRRFSEREAEIIRASRDELANHYTAHPEAAGELISVGDSEPDADLDPVALATWTMVCSQVMNLDEAITK